jgi:hypothetical protein
VLAQECHQGKVKERKTVGGGEGRGGGHTVNKLARSPSLTASACVVGRQWAQIDGMLCAYSCADQRKGCECTRSMRQDWCEKGA